MRLVRTEHSQDIVISPSEPLKGPTRGLSPGTISRDDAGTGPSSGCISPAAFLSPVLPPSSPKPPTVSLYSCFGPNSSSSCSEMPAPSSYFSLSQLPSPHPLPFPPLRFNFPLTSQNGTVCETAHHFLDFGVARKEVPKCHSQMFPTHSAQKRLSMANTYGHL